MKISQSFKISQGNPNLPMSLDSENMLRRSLTFRCVIQASLLDFVHVFDFQTQQFSQLYKKLKDKVWS